MNQTKLLIISTVLILATLDVKAQTSTTVDYSYESFSTPCNIFASAINVDGLEHRTSLSRPKYSDNSVCLESKTNNSTTVLSTIYSIKYSFKAGFNYKINVQYKGEKDAADGYFPRLGLKISGTNGGTASGTDCVLPSSYTTQNQSTFTQSDAGSNYAGLRRQLA